MIGLILAFLSGLVGLFFKMDTVDPNTGLTPRQKQAIRKCWQIVCKDFKKHAAGIFYKFLDDNPTYISKFRAFAGKSLSEIRETAKFRAHSQSVLHAFSTIVENLDDPECLVAFLEKIGTSHVPRKVHAQHFESLKKAVCGYLVETLGMEGNEFTFAAWEDAFVTINSELAKHTEKADIAMYM